ncbi:MAG TPA: lamin tail domain-containing protein [Pyrinomonadaceae bacterium]|nr:lamin tail domain-containing protein [Pyrinomonadaceae bacterium]
MIPTRLSCRLRPIAGMLLSFMVLGQGFFGFARPVAAQKRVAISETRFTKAQEPKGQDARDSAGVTSDRVTAHAVSVIDFKSLAAAEKKRAARARGVAPEIRKVMPVPQTIPEIDTPPTVDEPISNMRTAPTPPPSDEGGPLVPSPGPSQSFLAHSDDGLVIPPDTMGAVGLTKIMTTLNNNWVVQNKTTGAQLSGVTMDAFWSGTTAAGTFDPRVQYDPYNDRWIVAGVSNARSPDSSILIGVSDTSDPEGTFTLFRFQADDSSGTLNDEWADFPMLGFNKNWVAVGVNMFTNTSSAFTNGRVLVLDYPALRSGVFSGTYFSGITGANGGFCVHPATTFSTTENTLYAPAHQSSAGAQYRLHTITGTPAAPIFTVGALQTHTLGAWTQPGGEILPQTCIGTCPGNPREIDSGDAFIRSNVVFRNGFIWYAQTIALPAGTLTTNSRTAAQWTKLNTSGVVADSGRVQDPTATRTNGGQHYAYPSIAVNKNNDVLLGFSNFESDDLADAGYTFRLGTDAAGTMRDPVIFKEGEDYYAKTFSANLNRWGDYSHTVVDPVNDRDLWTIQEYAQPRTAQSNQPVTNNSRWGTWWAKVTVPAGAGDLIISEFRNRGPNGVADEYVEIYNTNKSALTVVTVDGSAGYSIVAQDNIVRCTIPSGTVIPAGGHYLCVNSQGYSLGTYPAGNGTTATGDATFTTDIPDNNGVALFRSSSTLDATNAIDSVGFTSTPAGLFKEGTGLPALAATTLNYAFIRDLCGKGGSPTISGPCLIPGVPADTNNNAADFIFVDPTGTATAAGQKIGAPSPENLSSTMQRNSTISLTILDPGTATANEPNRVRDTTSDPGNNSTLGTLLVRRTITNNTGSPITRLRFRVVDITTFPVPGGVADLRARTSPGPVVVAITGPNPACPGNSCTVQATTIETPPTQSLGGGLNSTISAGTVTVGTPIPAGGTVNIQFLLGVQQAGNFRFLINVEALP